MRAEYQASVKKKRQRLPSTLWLLSSHPEGKRSVPFAADVADEGHVLWQIFLPRQCLLGTDEQYDVIGLKNEQSYMTHTNTLFSTSCRQTIHTLQTCHVSSSVIERSRQIKQIIYLLVWTLVVLPPAGLEMCNGDIHLTLKGVSELTKGFTSYNFRSTLLFCYFLHNKTLFTTPEYFLHIYHPELKSEWVLGDNVQRE